MNIHRRAMLLGAIITMNQLSAMENGPRYCGVIRTPTESETKIVARTQKKYNYNNVPREYQQLCPKYEEFNFKVFYGAWNLSMSKLAVLQYVHSNDAEQRPLKKAQLTIIDAKQKMMMCNQFLDQKKYQSLAVSRSGTLFATIDHVIHRDEMNADVTEKTKKVTTTLTIQNMMGQQQKIELPQDFVMPSVYLCPPIFFNKRETKVTVYEQAIPKPDKIRYIVYPITIATPSGK